MKEYEMVYTMSEGYGNRYAKTLDAVVSAINNKHYDMLNLEVAKSKVQEVMKALELKMRFESLNNQVNGKLICNKTDFELETHKFESLDEVEKAIKNKVFL